MSFDDSPCVRAFWEDVRFPWVVRGPVDCCAFRVLADICAGVAMGHRPLGMGTVTRQRKTPTEGMSINDIQLIEFVILYIYPSSMS